MKINKKLILFSILSLSMTSVLSLAYQKNVYAVSDKEKNANFKIVENDYPGGENSVNKVKIQLNSSSEIFTFTSNDWFRIYPDENGNVGLVAYKFGYLPNNPNGYELVLSDVKINNVSYSSSLKDYEIDDVVVGKSSGNYGETMLVSNFPLQENMNVELVYSARPENEYFNVTLKKGDIFVGDNKGLEYEDGKLKNDLLIKITKKEFIKYKYNTNYGEDTFRRYFYTDLWNDEEVCFLDYIEARNSNGYTKRFNFEDCVSDDEAVFDLIIKGEDLKKLGDNFEIETFAKKIKNSFSVKFDENFKKYFNLTNENGDVLENKEYKYEELNLFSGLDIKFKDGVKKLSKDEFDIFLVFENGEKVEVFKDIYNGELQLSHPTLVYNYKNLSNIITYEVKLKNQSTDNTSSLDTSIVKKQISSNDKVINSNNKLLFDKTIINDNTFKWEKQEDGKWIFKNNNGDKLADSWVKDGNSWFRLNEHGLLFENSLFSVKEDMFFAENGGYISENKWVKSGDNWYYAKNGGYLAKNEWIFNSEKWYWFGTDSKMIENQWILINGKWYYSQENGDIVVNSWKMINGKWYHFNNKGELSISTKIGKYYVNENGEWIK